MPFHVPAKSGIVGGVSYGWRLQPARGETASGDALFAETGRHDGKTLFLLVDVTDHGPAAARVVELLDEHLLTDAVCANLPPAELLLRLHGMLQPVWLQTGRFVAALALLVDGGGSLQGSSAGQPPPWGRCGGQPWTACDVDGGFLLGVPALGAYGQTNWNLESSGLLLAFSDGVTEARDASGVMYGRGRLAAFLNGLPEGTAGPAVLDALLDDLRPHVGVGWPQDDTSVLHLWRASRS